MSIETVHPFQCNGCKSNCYTSRHAAARCCKQSSTDLRDGSVYVFSEKSEAEFFARAAAKWDAAMARAHYECSCGESFDEIDHAIRCRKGRNYTEAGYCTEVTDRDLDHKVVWSSQHGDHDAAVEEKVADATSGAPLTHNPFSSLLDVLFS